MALCQLSEHALAYNGSLVQRELSVEPAKLTEGLLSKLITDNPSGFASLNHLPLHRGGMGARQLDIVQRWHERYQGIMLRLYDLRAGIIVGEYLSVIRALLRHHVGSVLAHADSVTVAENGKGEGSVLVGELKIG